jgi:molecular chaperone DnaK
VTAKDLGTGKEQRITITATTQLSKDEVERLVKEAEQAAEEDKKRREEVELKNAADTLVYTTEKTLKEHGDKIPQDVKQKIESELERLKKAISDNDMESIKRFMDEVREASYKMSEELYKAQQASSGAGPSGGFGQDSGAESGGAGSQREDDTVIDAEFKDVD